MFIITREDGSGEYVITSMVPRIGYRGLRYYEVTLQKNVTLERSDGVIYEENFTTEMQQLFNAYQSLGDVIMGSYASKFKYRKML